MNKRRGSRPANGPVDSRDGVPFICNQPYLRGLSSARELIRELDSAFWRYMAQSPHAVGVAGLNGPAQSKIQGYLTHGAKAAC